MLLLADEIKPRKGQLTSEILGAYITWNWRERESKRRPREEKEQAWCRGEGLFLEKVNNVIVDLISKF